MAYVREGNSWVDHETGMALTDPGYGYYDFGGPTSFASGVPGGVIGQHQVNIVTDPNTGAQAYYGGQNIDFGRTRGPAPGGAIAVPSLSGAAGRPPMIPGPLGGLAATVAQGMGIPPSLQTPGTSTPGSTTGGGGGGGTVGADQSAEAIIRSMLGQLDLGDIDVGQIQDWIARGAGSNIDYLIYLIRGTDQWKTRYRAILERQKKGLSPLSEGDVIAYEQTAREMMRAADVPGSFFDSYEDFIPMLVADQGLPELQDRVTAFKTLAYDEPTEVRMEFSRLYGGDGTGAIAAAYMAPEQALPRLQRELEASKVGAASQRTMFGDLTSGQAEWLAGLGVSADAAQQGFVELQQRKELAGALPGEQGVGDLSKAELLGGQFGGYTPTRQEEERRARARAAVFGNTGGGFASGQRGLVGVGAVPD